MNSCKNHYTLPSLDVKIDSNLQWKHWSGHQGIWVLTPVLLPTNSISGQISRVLRPNFFILQYVLAKYNLWAYFCGPIACHLFLYGHRAKNTSPPPFDGWKKNLKKNNISWHWKFHEAQLWHIAALVPSHTVLLLCYKGRVGGWPPRWSGLLLWVELWPPKRYAQVLISCTRDGTFGKMSLCICSHAQVRSYWVEWVPESSDWRLHKRKEREIRTQRVDTRKARAARPEAEAGGAQQQARAQQGAGNTAAGRGRKDPPLAPAQRAWPCCHLDFRPSDWETVSFCCLKPPSLWCFVTAALGDWYTCKTLHGKHLAGSCSMKAVALKNPHWHFSPKILW